MTVDVTYDVITSLSAKFRDIFEKFIPGTLTRRFRIENRCSGLEEGGGIVGVPPPPRPPQHRAPAGRGPRRGESCSDREGRRAATKAFIPIYEWALLLRKYKEIRLCCLHKLPIFILI